MAILIVIYFGILVYCLATGNTNGGWTVAIISTFLSPSLGAAFNQCGLGQDERGRKVGWGGIISTLVCMALISYWVYSSDFNLRLIDTNIHGLAWIWIGAAVGYYIYEKRYGPVENNE